MEQRLMYAKWVTNFHPNHLILHQVLLLPIQGHEVSAISFHTLQLSQLYDWSGEFGHICAQDLCWTEPCFLYANLVQLPIQDVVYSLSIGSFLPSLSFL